jgi:hypothetical protein
MTIPPPFAHQTAITEFGLNTPRVMDLSDPGVGKTRGHLDFIANKRGGKKTLVFAPLTILETSWEDDAKKFTPDLRLNLAFAHNREAAFTAPGDVVVTNWDAAVWVAKQFKSNKYFLDDFDTLIIDESTGFKNKDAGRTKALITIRHLFEHRHALTGTPMPQSVLDLWSQALLIDDGKHLGANYYKFRNQTTVPRQVGRDAHMVHWETLPGAIDQCVKNLTPITIRFAAKDCIDIPENNKFMQYITLPPKALRAYKDMEKECVADINSNIVQAKNAGVRGIKLLQICTGAVYDENRLVHLVHTSRYELVMQLVQERNWPSLVLFNWQHEKNELVKLAEQAGVTFSVIDGETPATDRGDIVRSFQNGDLKVLFAHPRTVAYGLTLTTGRTTIWCSPTPNSEWFTQANKRIDRAGQRFCTETIMIAAKDTREEHIYDILDGKVARTTEFLELFGELERAA